ncbi:MAG: hypothetical protein JRG86_00660, partial [Deltaproteobacteria bacterium]|nr:hypothetical protein [Deltaproteobacteria bacterium]
MSVRIWLSMASFLMTVVMASGALAGGGGGGDLPRDTIGVRRNLAPSNPVWFLRSSNDASCGNITDVGFGANTDKVLAMDADGDGLDQITVFRDQGGAGIFYIADTNTGAPSVTSQALGAGTDIPVSGNFDTTDDDDEVGVYRPSTNVFYLDQGLQAPFDLAFGDPDDIPVVGNWDGSADGSDEVGVYRPSNNTFYLRADNLEGDSAVTVRPMGAPGDQPIVGDFDRDGTDTIGVYRGEAGGYG